MSIYIDMPQEVIDQMELNEEETVANGGAALAVYSKLQFCDTELTDALIKALLCYCELDTLAWCNRTFWTDNEKRASRSTSSWQSANTSKDIRWAVVDKGDGE